MGHYSTKDRIIEKNLAIIPLQNTLQNGQQRVKKKRKISIIFAEIIAFGWNIKVDF